MVSAFRALFPSVSSFSGIAVSGYKSCPTFVLFKAAVISDKQKTLKQLPKLIFRRRHTRVSVPSYTPTHCSSTKIFKNFIKIFNVKILKLHFKRSNIKAANV